MAQQPTKTVPGSSGGGEVPGLGKLKLDFSQLFLDTLVICPVKLGGFLDLRNW